MTLMKGYVGKLAPSLIGTLQRYFLATHFATVSFKYSVSQEIALKCLSFHIFHILHNKFPVQQTHT